tara:strand:- start:6395 stop:9655 length:3261 start_codon:yes stop_codon:yes gene_type:complete
VAEYRIVAKIDPQTSAGSNKVKQDLRGVQQEARATEQALNRSFDQAKFDRTIGGLVARLEQLDKSINNLSGASANMARANETTAQALDRMAASASKAKSSTDQQSNSAKQNAASQNQMEAALRRVLAATDAEAAEQMRLNALMKEAKMLLDAGKISQEQYARAQNMVNQATKNGTVITGQARAGMQQMGYQIGDVATMYSLGAKPAQIFSSQIGQISQALMLMGGDSKSMLGRVAGFLGGPWGIALSTATILLAPFIGKLFESNDALGDAIEKLKEDARATDIDAQAKRAFMSTVEGVTAAIREQNKELKENLQTRRDALIAEMSEAQNNLDNAIAQKARLQEDIRRSRENLRRLEETAGGAADTATRSTAIAAAVAERSRLAELEKQYKGLGGTIATATEAKRRADAQFAVNIAERAIDPIARINAQYDDLRKKLIETSIASTNYSEVTLTKEIVALEQRRKKALDAAQAQERLNKGVSDGVSLFKSREQAIGIAGREFQRAGFRVGENEQFGGVRGNHPGMGNKSHGKYAIDINSGTGVVEANVPELKAQFDSAARRYQSRGYRVLWNGWVYEANGDGPTRRIPAGQNQHRDHMHLEAPGTIVGRATNASTESQFQTEANQAQRLEERASDFVGAVVARAASRGLPNNRRDQLQADIDESFADFERRFNRAATEAEKLTIKTALTDADARETARAFEDAYVRPLERLQALQGKTGIDRDILNAKLQESAILGRDLTSVEEAMIENGIRQSDALERQQSILESIAGPLDDYRQTIAALNALLAEGAISQEAYNARMAEMAASAAGAVAGLPGIDPGTGVAYADIGAVADENARYAQELEQYANFREQLNQMGVDYDALREAAYQEHMNRLAQIDQARREVSYNAVSEIAASTTAIMRDAFGEQSRIARAAFVAEKAVAIARSIVAIQTGIAQASSLPFPANLPAIASVVAATASIVSNIRSVTVGYKQGGYTGDGPVNAEAGVVHGKEFVVNADATARNRPLLEALNAGRDVRAAAGVNRAAAAGGYGGERVIVQPTPAPAVNIRQINVTDPRQIAEYFATPEGEQLFINMATENADTIVRAANN